MSGETMFMAVQRKLLHAIWLPGNVCQAVVYVKYFRAKKPNEMWDFFLHPIHQLIFVGVCQPIDVAFDFYLCNFFQEKESHRRLKNVHLVICRHAYTRTRVFS